ncbi:MAG: hypothetical protein QM488_05320 [Rhizobiaceae bacterium]
MNLEAGRIFVLGAGFSAGAGIPLTNVLLPEAARIFADEAEGLFQRVCYYADQIDVQLVGSPNAEDFTRLCTHLEFLELREYAGPKRWSNDGSREKLALKFFLSKAIALHTPEPCDVPDYYMKFAKSLTPDDVVVTFNWDLLLEKVIIKSGGQFSYSFEVGKIHIIKLHGSINWINNEPRAMRGIRSDFDYQPLGLNGGLVKNEIFCSNLLSQVDQWHQAQALIGQVKPLIVLPGYGKGFDIRQLSALWYRLEFLAERTGGVSIIGLNVSHDDFIVESLFRYLFRGVFSDDEKISVLNPEPMVEQRFRDFSRGAEIEFFCEKFSQDTLEISLLQK